MSQKSRNMFTLFIILLFVSAFFLLLSRKPRQERYAPRNITYHEFSEPARILKINVLIRPDSEDSYLFDSAVITCENNYYIQNDNQTMIQNAGSETVITFDDLKEIGSIVVLTDQKNSKLKIKLTDGTGTTLPIREYRGELMIRPEENGLLLINRLLFEEYLYAVVPSEMPASYPIESLKAQAVCARTYASRYLKDPAYPEWNAHLDDSITFQVYNKIPEDDRTTKAVTDTKGIILEKDGKPAETYYYSTSCGSSARKTIWNDSVQIGEQFQTEFLTIKPNSGYQYDRMAEEEYFQSYITSNRKNELDCNEPWFRWKYVCENIDVKHILEVIKKIMQSSPECVAITTEVLKEWPSKTEFKEFEKINDLGNIPICEISTGKRQTGGVLDFITIHFQNGYHIMVRREYHIRTVLSNDTAVITKQDASTSSGGHLLPSGFFMIAKQDIQDEELKGFTLYGGGYGHGVGMSQNAAKNAADSSYSYEEILRLFYPGASLSKL